MGYRAIGFMLAVAAAAPSQAQGAVPEAIKARVNELVAQCVQAGGSLGAMTGQGRFVIPRDFNGDGRTDFIISEGNVPCTGKPALFRPGGLARLELWVAEGSDARLAFADRVLAYRVVDGNPARVQIARTGQVCAGPARCGDELRWNAAAGRFEEVATDGRKVAARPATGAAPASAMASAAPVATPAAGGPAAPAGAVPPVQAGAEARYKAACRQKYLAQKPPQTGWIDSACAEEWARIAASQPMTELLLRAVPAAPGGAPTVADLRQRLTGVRWAARPEQGSLASGQAGGYSISIAGRARPEGVTVGWSKIGADLPLDIPEALIARGATLTLTRCEKQGVGEGERVWSVALPGRPPFELLVSQRIAPTGGAWSFYGATARVDGAPAARGPTRCEQFW